MRRQSPQLTFFDQLASDRLVSSQEATSGPAKPGLRPAVRPVADVHSGHTCSTDNRDQAFRQASRRSLSTRQRVLDCIVRSGSVGRTREEISLETGLKVSSVCGRVSELLRPADPTERPAIGQDGTKRPGPGPDSGEQVVLFAVECLRFTDLPATAGGPSNVGLGEA